VRHLRILLRIAFLLAIGFTLQIAVAYQANSQKKQDPALARSYVAIAQKLLAAGDSANALEKLNLAVQADSRNADAYLLLGLTEFQRGETSKSIRHYRRALQLQPDSYPGHYNLGLAYLREHKLPESRAELEQALKLDPNQADAAYDLGIVMLELGHPAIALDHLTRAKRLNPERPDVFFNIVRAELEAGHISEARDDAQAGARRFGADFRWSASIGELFLNESQPADAAIYLRKASSVRPGDAENRRQLAVAYLESRQPKQVLDLITEPKTVDDYYLRGSSYYMEHRFSEAAQESEHALVLAPADPRVLVLRTRVLQRAGEHRAALELAHKAASVAPNWDEPYYVAGVSLYFIQRYTEAGQELARAVELNPKSVRALFLEAVALANQDKQNEAEVYLRRAITLQPNNARFHCHLGILLARENLFARAEESFRRAIKLAPNYGLAHYELGKVLVHAAQWREAAQELSLAIAQDPRLSGAYYQLARVYGKLGDTEKSKRMLADFERLHQQEANDSQALDDDTRNETESSEAP